MSEQQQSSPAAPAAQTGQPEPDRIRTINEIAERQDRMEGTLKTILDRLPGAPAPAPAPASSSPSSPSSSSAPDPGTVQQQMIAAIRAVNAENAASQQQPAQPPAEQRPREVARPRGRAVLQRRIFGITDADRR